MLKRVLRFAFSFIFATFLVCPFLIAQNIQIILGPDEIGENQAWTITISANNESLKSYDNFPDIDGLRKRGTSTQSQTSIVNGQISSSQSVVMTYVPSQQGTFNLPAFKMTVNGQSISSPGKKIKVGPPVQVRSTDPFRSFFDRDPANDFSRGVTEFVDVKEDALLALSTSKDEVFVGEGFTTTLSFLVADNNRAPMQFYELGKQLSEILKKLKPSNCWEENFNIENIEGEAININGKGFTQYKIYQATYYPLNTEAVKFPAVGLEMIKFKVAKNPSFFGQNRQEDFKTFNSKAKTVTVKALPPHPMKEAVAVGVYRLDERIGTTDLETGQSVGYEFNIFGEGNISSIEKPVIKKDNVFEFYEPSIKQSVNRENGRVTGTKSFNYFMIPKEPGVYHLRDYFQWVFFNPNSKKYDTLRSSQVVDVIGESQLNQAIESNDTGSFYDRIGTTNNTLQSSLTGQWVKMGVNIFVLLMLGATAFLVFKK
ncbi:MAG: BatD family protein [Bacteroidia bacterium]|nr:BatD family protein [Bacteroidia bacterium]